MKIFGKTISFEPKPEPAPAPVFVRADGAMLGDLVDREIERMKHEVKLSTPLQPENPRHGGELERMVRHGLAEAKNDQRATQQAKAAAEKYRREEERAVNAEIARQTPAPKDGGEFASYEMSDPSFL